jgi:hypothetical protein
MIYGPGEYEFSDFLRIGGPLTLLVLDEVVRRPFLLPGE